MKTISEEYRQVLIQTHKKYKGTWGNSGLRLWSNAFLGIMRFQKFNRVLDYGAGWGMVKDGLSKTHPHIEVIEYEPARAEVAASPEPCEMVICHDVLEHVEPEYLDNVIADLKRVTLKWGHFSVSTKPAVARLSDGRNAHLIVENFEWWIMKLAPHFYIRRANHPNRNRVAGEFWVERKDELDLKAIELQKNSS